MRDKLIKGYGRFRNGYFQDNRARMEQLVDKQTPQIAIVSCCDSRVDPSLLFDVEPGEVFVIRNVANLVPPFETSGGFHGTSAALEFAVTRLNVKQIVVLGHANCGGIRSLMENDTTTMSDSFIDSWMHLAASAKKHVLERKDLITLEQRIDVCEKIAVGYSIQNLMTYPWINVRVEAGELDLVGYYYDLRNGELVVLDELNQSTYFVSNAKVT